MRYIIYCRKSTEAEDRQVISIESQLAELRKIAERQRLSIIEVCQESKSAKAPGRPVFNDVMRKIRQKRADGILCWKLDRLARNPIDGGEVIWLLQQSVIKHIQTFDRGYFPEDNVLVLNVEFGMANQFVLDLSKNVKRGLRTKAEKGWFPSLAPLGYVNDRRLGKGAVTIASDPERFDLVRRMWDKMLSGLIPPREIHRMAVEDWGLRSPKGKKPSLSNVYRIFTSPFYSGSFEYPVGSGNWHQGAHEAMVSPDEYDRVQDLLGRKGRPRPKKHSFPLLHLLSCGECGGRITAEEKHQIICPSCRKKFSSNNKTMCPGCFQPIESMSGHKRLHYVYYHCTKKKHPECSQKAIERARLERDVEKRLAGIRIAPVFAAWAREHLLASLEVRAEAEKSLVASRERALVLVKKKLDNLLELRISPANTDGALLSDEEYIGRKADLTVEARHLEETIRTCQTGGSRLREAVDEIFDFAANAQFWFRNGSTEEKAAILQAIGSNLTVRDKKLILCLKKPFLAVESLRGAMPAHCGAFEPEENGSTATDYGEVCAQNPELLRRLEDVRTWCLENREPIIPDNTLLKLEAA